MRYLFLLVFLLGTLNSTASDLDNVVKTDSGYLAGSGTAIRSYKGIPFAAPPIGELRWRAPQPIKPWNTIRAAKSFSLSCPQVASGAIPKAKIGEDCLTVNVWTPAKKENEKLPVLVSIYGGGFVSGTSEYSIYDGERLATRGVVVVSFNYRLGIFGFFAHPELSKESADGVSGNYALLDMVAALKWVQRNISAFGGDPSDVTIWGESAGATAVSLLMVMPSASGLFQKAIANSPWNMYHEINRLRQSSDGHVPAEALGARFGTLASLRAKSMDELIDAARQSANPLLTIDPYSHGETFLPTVDGVVLPDDPASLFARGQFHHVALIAGTTADEGVFFAPRLAADKIDGWLGDQFGAQVAERIKTVYGIDNNPQSLATIVKLTGDSLCLMGARSILRSAAKYNANVYQYEFTRINGAARRARLNAHHGADLGYVYGTLPDSILTLISPAQASQPGDYTEVDERLSQAMMGAIVQFAKTGNPNGKNLPNWPAYRNNKSYLDYGDAIEVKRSLRTEQLDLLDSIYAQRRERGVGSR